MRPVAWAHLFGRELEVQLGADLGDLRAEDFVAAFLNSNTLLPTDAEGVGGDVGTQLSCGADLRSGCYECG